MENNLDCSKYKNKDGVSCYRNSILAILQSLPIFSNNIIDIENFQKFYNKCTEEGKNITHTITYQLFKLFNLILSIIPPIYLEQFALLSDISIKLYPKAALKVITNELLFV